MRSEKTGDSIAQGTEFNEEIFDPFYDNNSCIVAVSLVVSKYLVDGSYGSHLPESGKLTC